MSCCQVHENEDVGYSSLADTIRRVNHQGCPECSHGSQFWGILSWLWLQSFGFQTTAEVHARRLGQNCSGISAAGDTGLVLLDQSLPGHSQLGLHSCWPSWHGQGQEHIVKGHTPSVKAMERSEGGAAVESPVRRGKAQSVPVDEHSDPPQSPGLPNPRRGGSATLGSASSVKPREVVGRSPGVAVGIQDAGMSRGRFVKVECVSMPWPERAVHDPSGFLRSLGDRLILPGMSPAGSRGRWSSQGRSAEPPWITLPGSC
jgi:hypothetical protein